MSPPLKRHTPQQITVVTHPDIDPRHTATLQKSAANIEAQRKLCSGMRRAQVAVSATLRFEALYLFDDSARTYVFVVAPDRPRLDDMEQKARHVAPALGDGTTASTWVLP